MAEKKVYTVDDYKNLLGSGQRGNMYKINLVFPAAIVNPDAERAFEIMCDTGTMPGERPIEPINIPYEGDNITIAGDKSAPEVLTYAFRNSEVNLFLRKQFKLWSQLIQQDNTGQKTPPAIYKTDSFFISLLDYKKEVIEKIQCIGSFINTCNNIEVGQDGSDITKTEISIAMDSFITII